MVFGRVLIDLDDTLLNTAELYLDRIKTGCELIGERLDIDPETVEKRREEIDAELNTGGDFDIERFPRSFVHAYQVLCDEHDQTSCRDFEQTLFDQGMTVYDDVPERYDEAHDTLKRLKAQYDLHLYTLGHPSVQREKISEHNFEKHLDAMHIVPEKTADQIHQLFAPYPAERCIVIGDSKLHDIKPALQTGASALLKNGMVDWAFQHSDVPSVPTINRLDELQVPVRRHFSADRVS